MAAKTGNKTAEKYDLATTIKVIGIVEHHLQTFDIPLFKRALAQAGLQPHVWSYLKRKWKDNDDIMDTMIRIEGEFEGKLIVGGLRRQYHAGIVMLIMRSKYGYNDKQKEEEEDGLIPEEEATAQEAIAPQAPVQKKDEDIDWLGLPLPTTEECLSDHPPFAKDFRPRATDTATEAHLRADAAKRPARYFSVPPISKRGNYMHLAADLYKTLY